MNAYGQNTVQSKYSCGLKRLRAAWPDTHIVLRGDGHFSNPELMQLAIDDPLTDFIFGLTDNAVLSRWAQPFLETNKKRHETRCENARRTQGVLPHSTRSYHEVDYAAQSWPHAFRVILKAAC